MDHRGIKVFFATCFGALLGSTVALEMTKEFWWVGLIVGALSGYLSYEFRTVLSAIRTAWRRVFGWRANFRWWGRNIAIFVTAISVTSILFAPATFYIIYLPGKGTTGLLIVYIALWVICSGLGLEYCISMTDKDKPIWPQEFFQKMLRHNILFFYVWQLPKYLVLGFIYCFKWVPEFIQVCWAFVKQVFVIIHSELRVLCAIHAAMGALTGYAYGNAIIGMLAGGGLALLSYEILSKRVLKVVPAKEESGGA